MTKVPDAFRTIGEVSLELDVPKHVLRFWEQRFKQIKPMKRGGNRRLYRPEDVELLKGIKQLLQVHSFTIKGVQRILRDRGIDYVKTLSRGGAAISIEPTLPTRTSSRSANPESAEPETVWRQPAVRQPATKRPALVKPDLSAVQRDILASAIRELISCRNDLGAAPFHEVSESLASTR